MSCGTNGACDFEALVHLARGGVFSDPIENRDIYSRGVKGSAGPLDVARGDDARIGDEKCVRAESAREFADDDQWRRRRRSRACAAENQSRWAWS